MAIVKLTNSNYVIQTPLNATSNITLDTDTVYIKGNLTVLGSQTALETTNSTLKDNIIVLNDGETGSGVTLGTAGLLVYRGSSANVSLLWNESVDKWQITSDGTTYANILSSTGSGTGLSAVIEDPSPALGGNLNTNGKTISSNVGNLKFGGNLQVNYTLATPSAVTNAVTLYTSAPNSAGSGLYVANSNGNDELVTKTKAIVFSIIL